MFFCVVFGLTLFNVSANIIGVGNPEDLPLRGIPKTLAYWLDYYF